MSILHPAELDEIQARADAATAGPWDLVQRDGLSDEVDSIASASTDEDVVLGQDEQGGPSWLREEDAEFIIHAREDIPKLLAALRDVLYAVRQSDVEEYIRLVGAEELSTEALDPSLRRECIEDAVRDLLREEARIQVHERAQEREQRSAILRATEMTAEEFRALPERVQRAWRDEITENSSEASS